MTDSMPPTNEAGLSTRCPPNSFGLGSVAAVAVGTLAVFSLGMLTALKLTASSSSTEVEAPKPWDPFGRD